MTLSHEDRPWGTFYVLVDQDNTKVKRLVVNPGQRLSLQSHKQRDEHWVITRGKALINLDDETIEATYGTHAVSSTVLRVSVTRFWKLSKCRQGTPSRKKTLCATRTITKEQPD